MMEPLLANDKQIKNKNNNQQTTFKQPTATSQPLIMLAKKNIKKIKLLKLKIYYLQTANCDITISYDGAVVSEADSSASCSVAW